MSGALPQLLSLSIYLSPRYGRLDSRLNPRLDLLLSRFGRWIMQGGLEAAEAVAAPAHCMPTNSAPDPSIRYITQQLCIGGRSGF